MDKSPDAFRTISEVADALETPAHVLRFWESRFPQIKPIKRAGGRRYYRPADVALLSGIRHLLHDQGMTIRGVQKILREQGVRHVATMSGIDPAEFTGEGEDAVLDVMAGDADQQAEMPDDDDAGDDAGGSGRIAFFPTQPERPAAGSVAGNASPEPAEPEPAAANDPAANGIFAFTGFTRADQDRAATDAAARTPSPDVTEAEVVPEAPYVHVDAEPDLPFAATRLHPGAEPVRPALDAAPARSLAGRLRALPRPVSPDHLPDLAELHSRLGLLHAQMAEALRQRR